MDMRQFTDYQIRSVTMYVVTESLTFSWSVTDFKILNYQKIRVQNT